MTILAIRLLDRTGRRPLLICGTVGMAVGMCAAALAVVGVTHLTGGRAAVAIAALALVFFIRRAPETKGRSLPAIEAPDLAAGAPALPGDAAYCAPAGRPAPELSSAAA